MATSQTSDSGGILIRRAEPSDAEAAALVIVEARVANLATIPPMNHPPHDVIEWFTNDVMPNNQVWVAASGEDIVATLVLATGWIEQLYVVPQKTNRGIGGRLVELAKTESLGRLELWTFASNLDAARFYQRHGFHEQERTEADNEEKAPDIRFLWERAAGPSS